MAIYYLDGSVETGGSGSELSPFKTFAEFLAVAIDGDALYIADGEYGGGTNYLNITVPNLTIEAISGLPVFSLPDTYPTLRIQSSGSGLKMKNIICEANGIQRAWLCDSGVTGFMFDGCVARSGTATNDLVDILGCTGWEIIRSKVQSDGRSTSFRSAINIEGASSGKIIYSEVASKKGMCAIGIYQKGSGTIDIIGSIIDHCENTALNHTGTGTTNLKNSMVFSGAGYNTAYPITQTAGVVNADNCLLNGNPWNPTYITSGTIAQTSCLENVNPKIIGSRGGFVVPHVDDASNLAYAKEVENELASRGLNGGYYIEMANWNNANNQELIDMVNRGTMEVCAHSWSHTDPAYTHGLSFTQTGGVNPTVIHDGSWLHMVCDGSTYDLSMPLSDDTTIGDVIAWVDNRSGWTVTKSSTDGQDTAKIYSTLKISSLEQTTGKAVPCDLDMDRTGYGQGFFYDEITNVKAALESIITINDPQTIQAYQCNSFGNPHNTNDADYANAAKEAGFTSLRSSEYQAIVEQNLYSVTAVAVSSLIVSGDESATKAKVYALGHSIASTGLFCMLLSHNADQASITEWGWVLDALQEFDITITSAQLATEAIKANGTYSLETGIVTTEYSTEVDYRLQSTSPAIDAGVIASGVNDTGHLDPYGNATNATPNIGSDQTSDQNLYREDAGFAYNETSYTVRVKKILPTA